MGEYRLKIGVDEFGKEIQGAEDFTQTIIRDFNEKLYRLRGDYNLKAWQGLYALLYANLVTDGLCSSNEGRLYFRGDAAEAFSELWRGQIKPQDGEYDLINSSVDTQILDNSWSAKLNNSQDQKVNLKQKIDRNGNPISVIPAQETSFYDPSDGSYYASERETFKVFDAFTFLINYHTEGSVSFASDYFNTNGTGDQYHLVSGKELRRANGRNDIEISFSELFDELQKKFNLWIIIESDDFDNPVIRIEPESYVLVENKSLEVENPESVLVKTNLDRLYTSVKVGCDASDYDPTNDASYPARPLKDWNEEIYNTKGSCDFENNELDLVSTYKIDSNSIEIALKDNSDEFDDSIFIVEVDVSNNAIQFTNAVTNGNDNVDYFYNFNLSNEEVLKNWFTTLPTLISDLYYCYVDTVTTQIISTSGRVKFTNDNVPPAIDADNMYVTATENPTFPGFFQAPVTGVYTFTIVFNLAQVISPFTADVFLNGFNMDSLFVVDDKQEILLESYTLQPGIVQISRTVSMNLEADNYASIRVVDNDPSAPPQILSGGYLEVNGGVYKYDISAPFNINYEYDIQKFQLSVADFNTIRDSRGYVRFLDTITGRAWNVWPTEMTYSHEKQLVTKGTFIGRSPLNILTDLCWVLEGQYGLGAWDDECYWIDGYGWVDFCSDVVSNPIFAGNPVTDWSLTQGTQIAENQFQTPAIGNVIISQSITLAAGSYTLYYNVTVDNTSPWLVSAALTGSTGLGNLFSLSTNLNESGEVSFTYTGGTNTLTITGNDGAPPPQTIFTFNLINIC